MSREQLNKAFPTIASHFEDIIYGNKRKGYKSVRYDYVNTKRGISLEKVFRILYLNGIEPRLEILPWYKAIKL